MFNKHCLLKILNHLHQWFHPGDVAASSVLMLWRWMERPLSTQCVFVCVCVLKAHANSSNEINYLYTQWNVRLWSVRAHVRNSFDLCLDIIFFSLSLPFSIFYLTLCHFTHGFSSDHLCESNGIKVLSTSWKHFYANFQYDVPFFLPTNSVWRFK